MNKTTQQFLENLPQLLVSPAEAAKMLGLSKAMLYQLLSQGRVGPKVVAFGSKCKRFSVQELTDWCASGCPSREEWQAVKGGRDGQ